ncbi:MAG: 50S ribosomal protein L2 [Parcubacteria group bacterium SW_4_46_8]|nr:MAG: 50S ribosomal protein L2 [Parcubacteria group bacterium SW_4_46_8]
MKDRNPTTPSKRQTKTPSFSERLSDVDGPYKPLTRGLSKQSGRNSDGRITMEHRGGGHKRRYRLVDFDYDKKDIPAQVETIEYDPNRSAFIALVCYADGERRYVIAHDEMEEGDMFVVSADAPIEAGNRLPLSEIPVGTEVYNVELQPNGGAKIARSAGSAVEVTAKEEKYVNVKMPSTEVRKVLADCWATIGTASNVEHGRRVEGKAGRRRWQGWRPKVRGTAKNAVDHPYGGGEGRTGRGTRREKTATGRSSGKGQKTRKPNKYSDKLIVERRTNKNE